MTDNQTIVKKYRGSEDDAFKEFKEDAERLALKGYYPTSQSFTPGNYGCGAFLFALLLCFLLIGILIFIYMLVVKPDGYLPVTYEYRGQNKTCPKCAESIKAQAKICRYCGFEFKETPTRPLATPLSSSPGDIKKIEAVRCRKCGAQISKSFATCPSCGAKNQRAMMAAILAVMFLTLVILASYLTHLG